MSCGGLNGTGAWGRMDTCACMAESLCGPPETITALFIGKKLKQTKYPQSPDEEAVALRHLVLNEWQQITEQ